VVRTSLGQTRFRFGVFEVELRAGELRQHGIKIKLQEQPFQTLALLLERSGDVVTRDELRSRLWSADTFVDFDRGLNKAINRLREALDDAAENPRFIETIPKRGYRFLASVELLTVPGRPETAPAPQTTSPRQPFVRSSLLPPRKQSFLPSNFAISPDGTALAFIALDQDTGRNAMWVRPLSANSARRLDGADDGAYPFWSPDCVPGRHIDGTARTPGSSRRRRAAQRPRPCAAQRQPGPPPRARTPDSVCCIPAF